MSAHHECEIRRENEGGEGSGGSELGVEFTWYILFHNTLLNKIDDQNIFQLSLCSDNKSMLQINLLDLIHMIS